MDYIIRRKHVLGGMDTVKGDKREKLAVLFGIMAANAVAVAKRRNQQESPPINKAATEKKENGTGVSNCKKHPKNQLS